jgi:hypothetical protein
MAIRLLHGKNLFITRGRMQHGGHLRPDSLSSLALNGNFDCRLGHIQARQTIQQKNVVFPEDAGSSPAQ